MDVPVGRANEVAEKTARVRSLLPRFGLKGVLLRRANNIAWFTGGRRTYVGLTTDVGVASILITANRVFLLTNRIEDPRLTDEESLRQAGFEFIVTDWYGSNPSPVAIAGGAVGADVAYADTVNIANAITPLRYSLVPDEVERYRWLGHTAATIIQSVAQSLTPGMTEDSIAGLLGGALFSQGIVPSVLLVASDERVYRYRHPLPTDKKLERYAMLVIGARRWGLHVSCTRLVYFGALPAELRAKAQATGRIDATFIAHTRPGVPIADIFRRGQQAYADAGYPDEWQLHHQGGACGYDGRDYRATPTSQDTVAHNQAFAWNPSIAGSKSEDTVLITDDGFEVLSYAPGWPTWSYDVNGLTVERPAILELSA